MSKQKSSSQKSEATVKKALQRGVVPILRPLSPVSYELFDYIADRLDSEIHGIGRIYREESLSVTVVGLSRFTAHHLTEGPHSSEIIADVASTRQSFVDIPLGRIGLYASKLAYELKYPPLYNEITALEKTYDEHGFPLKPARGPGQGAYVAHWTVANLYASGREYYKDNDDALERLNRIANVIGQTIDLQPVALPQFK